MAEALSQNDIDTLLAQAAQAGPRTSSPGAAALAPPPSIARRRGTVRTMDFARPSKFNKDQLRTLQMLHEAFCRRASTYLSASVRSLVTVQVTRAEQIPYGDFVASLPVPACTAVLEVAPHGTNAMTSLDLPLVFGILDRMLGGPGGGEERARELTEIELELATGVIDRLLQELSAAWGDLVPVEFRLRGVEMNAHFAQIASVSEPCVLVEMELSIGTATGTMSVCLPYRSIGPVVGELTAHRYFAGSEPHEDQQEDMLANLREVRMPVRAMVGSAPMLVDDVLALQPGDVIPLRRRVNQGVQLVIGDSHTHEAVPGRYGERVAVRVVRRLPQAGGLPQ